MKTDWIFNGIKAWINEGNGRMAKIWGESIVAHFARKVRATDMGRSRRRQHCSSLCLQSEGDEYSGGQARVENLKGHAPDFRHMSVALTLRAK